MLGFSRKKLKPPCSGYQWKFPGVRVKIVGIPRAGMSKFEGKTRLSRGVTVLIKLTGNPGVKFKKSGILNRGYNFFLEKPIEHFVNIIIKLLKTTNVNWFQRKYK